MSVRGNSKSALASAFDIFLNEAFGSNTTISAGGRSEQKKRKSLVQRSAKQRIQDAQQKLDFENTNDKNNFTNSRRSQISCKTNLSSVTGSALPFRYADDEAPVNAVFVQKAENRNSSANALASAAQIKYPSNLPKRIVIRKIDAGNRLLCPTVGFAAKHVAGAKFIESLSDYNDTNSHRKNDDLEKKKKSQSSSSKMVKKAFRHLHDALIGADLQNTQINMPGVRKASKLSVEEFHRKSEAREKERIAKLERMRIQQQLQEEQVL